MADHEEQHPSRPGSAPAHGPHGSHGPHGAAARRTSKASSVGTGSLGSSVQSGSVASTMSGKQSSLYYDLEEIPPWHLSIILVLQNFVVALVTQIMIHMILIKYLCQKTPVASHSMGAFQSTLMSSGFFTLFQTLLGIRLPVVVGASIFILGATPSLLAINKKECPDAEIIIDEDKLDQIVDHRMGHLQGAILIAGLFEVMLGLTGVAGLIIKTISPLAISSCTMTLGISLRHHAIPYAIADIRIAIGTMILMTILNQYMRKLVVPFTGMGRNGLTITNLPIFTTFSILLTIIIMWGICAYFEISGPDEASKEALAKTAWFLPPITAKSWHTPQIEWQESFLIMPAILMVIVMSVQDYLIMSELVNATHPPQHAINRCCVIEGLATVATGLSGSATAMGVMSDNAALVILSKVGSRLIICLTAVLLLIISFLPKLIAWIFIIPPPIIGGLMLVWFGTILALGVSLSANVNISSPRNLFVIGTPTFLGLMLPQWVEKVAPGSSYGKNYMNFTGSEGFDKFVTSVLFNDLYIAGILGVLLDLIIPGSMEERGKIHWRSLFIVEGDDMDAKDTIDRAKKVSERSPELKVYDIPFLTKTMFRAPICTYVPLCPPFLPSAIFRMMTVKYWLGGSKRKRGASMMSDDSAYRGGLTISHAVLEDTMRL